MKLIVFILFLHQLQFSIRSQEIKGQNAGTKGMCTKETSSGCGESSSTKPILNNGNNDEVSRRIISKIEKAREKYKPCSTATEPEDTKCECHQKVWKKDLEVFQKKGITRQNIKDATKYGTLYKIFNNKLYRQMDCFFPARCEGIEHFLLKLLPSLPNMDFVINTRDYPQISGRFSKEALPVFSFSKTEDYRDIMYPAWTFWAGGPAIKLFPTGIGRWDVQREKIKQAANDYAWEKKIGKGFFRGSRTSHERDSLILLSRSKPDLVDAAYTKNQAWKSPKDTLGAEPAEEVSFEYHCQFKYLFNFRGVAASFRFKHLFLCRSLVFHVGSEWLEFFYPALKPWKHYVPLAKDPSQAEIEEILEFFKRNDNLAKDIAEAGYDFIWRHLRMEDVECYWRSLMLNYAKLLKYQVVEDKSLIEVKEKKSTSQKRKRSDEF
ncbi:O-glucosyltransferase rumi-like [Musca autumnalis]|uniref:O-glucosyltransferase rumi-like n=1 Tax=Musca autumnalis TaxID=221902 RepID=UPI003CF19B35